MSIDIPRSVSVNCFIYNDYQRKLR